MTDLRALLLGAGAWAGALAVLLLPPTWACGVLSVAAAGLVAWAVVRARTRGGDGVAGPAGLLLAMLAVAGTSALHLHAVAASPVAELARQGAAVRLDLVITTDPRASQGPYGPVVTVRAKAVHIVGRGKAFTTRSPVVVLGDAEWSERRLGERIRTHATLISGEDDVAALVRPRGPSEVLGEPSGWWRGAEAVRASVRRAVADRGEDERALLPALVDGDDAQVSVDLADDFRATGLTHLLAVSGTNLTIVVGALLLLGRWAGVRGRWAWLLGGAGVIGFILLARTEPSVVRAAAMGSVALIGMGSNGLSRGLRCLGAGVLGLLLVNPWLATTVGFALSVLATAGILLLAPAWRDALCRWLPRWIAEAVSVPLAAQVACTPLVAAISGQVSLVAVAANLLVGPAVAPATVLGLAGGLIGLAWPGLGEVVAMPGAWCVKWIATIARWGADLPTASVAWGTGAWSLIGLTLLCGVGVWAAPRVLRSRSAVVVLCVALGVVVAVRPPTRGWPPPGWVAVMCDVGQGDATVLRAGEGVGVLVDAGPDPEAVDRCLSDLGVTSLALVVLTHFHADHTDGLSGALAGRSVGTVTSTWFTEPAQGHAGVTRTLGYAPEPLVRGLDARVGAVSVRTLWPLPAGEGVVVPYGPDDANDSSVVLLAEMNGVRILLTGDLEPDAQTQVAKVEPALSIDVLKVPHHGSRHQDLSWLAHLGASVALVGVGADNGYGHPAGAVLAALSEAGAVVGRTDTDGDLAVVVDEDGRVDLHTRGR